MRPLLFLLLLLLPLTTTEASTDTLQIFILDVGEGQAILLKRMNKGVLIDTGHAGMARSVLDKLDNNGVTQLDHLIFTHLHPDHASGYFRIREAFPNTIIHDSGDKTALSSPIDIVRWVANSLSDDPKREVLKAEDRLNWMDVEISVLWPYSPESTDLNRNSLVLVIHYFDSTAMVMGDAGSIVEQQLLQNNSLPKNIELLVAGHHGSANTSSTQFLQKINPETCVISVNINNVRNYPSSTTVERLTRHCQRVLRTDVEGDIKLVWKTYSHSPGRYIQ